MNDLVQQVHAAIDAFEATADGEPFQRGHTMECDWWGDLPGYCSCDSADRIHRRCAADRRRLERHAPAEPGIGHFPSARFKDPDARICAHCSHDGDWGATVWPCLDFTDLMDSYGLTDQQEGGTRG